MGVRVEKSAANASVVQRCHDPGKVGGNNMAWQEFFLHLRRMPSHDSRWLYINVAPAYALHFQHVWYLWYQFKSYKFT